jgi:hypothetical protein
MITFHSLFIIERGTSQEGSFSPEKPQKQLMIMGLMPSYREF